MLKWSFKAEWSNLHQQCEVPVLHKESSSTGIVDDMWQYLFTVALMEGIALIILMIIM